MNQKTYSTQMRQDFFMLLPDTTHTFKCDRCHDGKKGNERITLMIAANIDGHEKLPLLAIVKSARPRCFKNVRNLPVEQQESMDDNGYFHRLGYKA